MIQYYEMSPTVHREAEFRFYFFSREEARPHVHVETASGEAKFWLEPIVALAMNKGMSPRQLRSAQRIVEKQRDAILKDWKTHFKKA